jgi:hypothetical protein
VAFELQRYLEAARRSLQTRHGKPFQNPANAPFTGESDLLRRSGDGTAGIRAESRVGTPDEPAIGRLLVPFPLSVHERGAVVRATRAQYLAIPMPAALDGRGLPLRRSPRDWENTFVRRSTRGHLLIFQRRFGRLTPLYLLKREVRLPPRLRAEETLEAGADFFFDSAVEAAVRELRR